MRRLWSGSTSGFTLIEILVSAGLMVIVIATVTAIFSNSVKTGEGFDSISSIYKTARYALDMIHHDLRSTDPFDGNQRFILENGYYDVASGSITINDEPSEMPYDVHTTRAADKIIFRANIPVGDVVQHGEVQYYLIPIVIGGNVYKTSRNNNPLYRLVRRVYMPKEDQQSQSPVYTEPPRSDLMSPYDIIVCDNVLSFNIEYYSDTGTYSQIAPSPCPLNDPLGDNDVNGGVNDTGPNTYTISSLRITLMLTDGNKETNVDSFERVIDLVLQ